MATIPSLETHRAIYKSSTPFPAELDALYLTIGQLPWDEYFIVFKHTDFAPLDLIGKALEHKQYPIDDKGRRWAGKCARTIMEANGFQLITLPNGKTKQKRSSSALFSRAACFERV